MGKNHRHKKNLKADKAKIKLKQTKTQFLPKGLNETKATFKIKPIVLAQKLKEDISNTDPSKRKLNIKDLCSRMNHYNVNIRFAACEELVHVYKQYSEDIIREHLYEVILNVSNLIQDREKKVRNAAVKVITIILEMTPSGKLEPFFNYFLTNMRCAMTHIDQSIQEDSLKFLDCFLVKDCGLISKTSEKFLPDFFTLISRLRNESSLGPTLTINLGSKMTSVTWRIKVLSRLHAVLDLILKKSNDKNERNIDFFAESANTVPIYKKSFYNILANPNLDGFKTNPSSESTLDSHLSTLIPVFYDIWMEVVPEKKLGKSLHESTYLNDDSCAILWNLVNTMYLLWKYIETTQTEGLRNIFISSEATKFLNHLLENFPYCQNEMNSKMKKVTVTPNSSAMNTNTDPNCVRENIIICYIYFVLNANFSRNTSKAEMEKISAYINKCLLTKKYVNQNNIQYVIEFIRVSLLEQGHVWKKCKTDARKILENVLVFYNSGFFGEHNKIKIFKILADLVDNPYLSKCSHYHSWLSSLPEMLCKSQVSDAIVETLLELARKNTTPFLTALKLNSSRILRNLDSMKIILTKKSYKDENIVKREIIFIFYYLNEALDPEMKECLQHLENETSKQHSP